MHIRCRACRWPRHFTFTCGEIFIPAEIKWRAISPVTARMSASTDFNRWHDTVSSRRRPVEIDDNDIIAASKSTFCSQPDAEQQCGSSVLISATLFGDDDSLVILKLVFTLFYDGMHTCRRPS